MIKKNDKKTVVNDNSIVLVNVVRSFRDATDNNREISSGPNSYYRTSKDRASKLIAAGFCKYEDEELEVTKAEIVKNLNDTRDDSNSTDNASTNSKESNAADDNIPNE